MNIVGKGKVMLSTNWNLWGLLSTCACGSGPHEEGHGPSGVPTDPPMGRAGGFQSAPPTTLQESLLIQG